MANVIKPKRSNTASNVPTTGNLASGELAVNMADRKVYINNGTSVVQVGAGLLSALGDVTITSPTNGQSLSYNGTAWVNATGAGSGTVTSVSVVSANGLAGTVATATSTPAITLTTTVTGLVKGNGTALSAAVSGTDYSAGTSALGTGIVKSTTTTGALTIAVAGDFPTLNQNTTGSSGSCTGNAATATTATNQSGGTVSATTGSFSGTLSLAGSATNQFIAGTGDAASFTTYNFALSGWNGMAFYNPTSGGTFPNTTSGVIDFRNGIINMKGGFQVNGTAVALTNGNITGTSANVTGTVAIANGGTGATTNTAARTNLGATTVGSNFFTLTNPSAITFPRMNADNTVSSLDAATFRTAIGAGTSSTTGTVTSVATGTGLSGGTITTSGTISLANTAVTAGSYTNTNITVDAQGRITAAANGSAGGVTSVTGTAPVVSSGGATPAISMAAATTSVNGYLTSTDWNTFNGKQAALGFTPYNATNPSNYIALASAITGYTVGANTALAATDTLLAGLGKIQGQINARSGTVTSVGGTGTVAGLTLTGTVTTSGNLTLGGNLSITADMIYDTFTATASQTTFTASTTYTASKIEVYVNGVKMRNGSDVTVSGGTSVVFALGLAAGSLVDLVYPI